MLRENRKAKGEGDEPRRWFADEDFDLVVFEDAAGGIAGFHLCYDKQGAERALAWEKERGWRLYRVEGGEELPTENRSPVLRPEFGRPPRDLGARFSAAGANLDPGLVRFILGKIREVEEACPRCHRPIYDRRRPDCGYCGAPLAEGARFSAEQDARVKAMLEEDRRRFREFKEFIQILGDSPSGP